jgi:hypothetical protein
MHIQAPPKPSYTPCCAPVYVLPKGKWLSRCDTGNMTTVLEIVPFFYFSEHRISETRSPCVKFLPHETKQSLKQDCKNIQRTHVTAALGR